MPDIPVEYLEQCGRSAYPLRAQFGGSLDACPIVDMVFISDDYVDGESDLTLLSFKITGGKIYPSLGYISEAVVVVRDTSLPAEWTVQAKPPVDSNYQTYYAVRNDGRGAVTYIVDLRRLQADGNYPLNAALVDKVVTTDTTRLSVNGQQGGVIVLDAGYNSTIVSERDSNGGVLVTINAAAGTGLGKVPAVEQTGGTPWLLSVAGATGANVDIADDQCIGVTASPSTLALDDACAPCVDCTKLANTYGILAGDSTTALFPYARALRLRVHQANKAFELHNDIERFGFIRAARAVFDRTNSLLYVSIAFSNGVLDIASHLQRIQFTVYNPENDGQLVATPVAPFTLHMNNYAVNQPSRTPKSSGTIQFPAEAVVPPFGTARSWTASIVMPSAPRLEAFTPLVATAVFMLKNTVAGQAYSVGFDLGYKSVENSSVIFVDRPVATVVQMGTNRPPQEPRGAALGGRRVLPKPTPQASDGNFLFFQG